MSRFYTNPFVKDAPMAHVVEVGPERYDGVTMLADGRSYHSWSQLLKYSDGHEAWREARTAPLGLREIPWSIGNGRGVAIRGLTFEEGLLQAKALLELRGE